MIIIPFSHSCVGNRPQPKTNNLFAPLETLKNGWEHEMILHDLLWTQTIVPPKLEGNMTQESLTQAKQYD